MTFKPVSLISNFCAHYGFPGSLWLPQSMEVKFKFY